MKIYSAFASVYDALMFDAPYGEWAKRIDGWVLEQKNALLGKKNICHGGVVRSGKILLDLGCGTGSMSLLFAKMGYSVIGVDSSEDMLALAHEKSAENGCEILFVKQDIRELDLYGTVDVCISVCDVMNYILETEKLQRVFDRVNLFMNPGGVFIFDMNTVHKYRDKMQDKTFAGTGAGGEGYVWVNKFCEETMVNEYDVVFTGHDGKHFFREKHLQRAYGSGETVKMLHGAGFGPVRVHDGYSDEPLQETSIRAVYVATKAGKTQINQ